MSVANARGFGFGTGSGVTFSNGRKDVPTAASRGGVRERGANPGDDGRTTSRSPWVIVTESVDQLTAGQRDCLRLVYRHMTSKDIARALDISPHTVDMRLRTAMRTLSVGSRIEAARLLVESEAGTYQPLIYQAPELGGAAVPVTDGAPASTTDDDHAHRHPNTRLEPGVEAPADGPPRFAGALRHGEGRPPTPLAQSLPWGDRNRLSPGARLAWIAMIAIGSALGFGAILGALEALKKLL